MLGALIEKEITTPELLESGGEYRDAVTARSPSKHYGVKKGLPSSNWEKSTAYAAFVCLGRSLAVLIHESSDVGFVVEFEKGRNLFDLIALRLDLRELLGVEVDVVTPNSLRYIRTRVLDEAKRI